MTMLGTLFFRRACVLACVAVAGLAWCGQPALGREKLDKGDKKSTVDEVAVTIQGVLASGRAVGGEAKVDASLAAHRDALLRFPFAKFENIGSASGSVPSGRSASLKVGSHTVELTLTKSDKGAPRLSYTVQDAGGKQIGAGAMNVRPGRPQIIQLGDPTVPVMLIFQMQLPAGGKDSGARRERGFFAGRSC